MADFDPALNYILDYEDAPRSYKIATDNNGGQVVAGINSKSFPADVAAIVAVPQYQRAPLVANFYRSKLWIPMMLGGLDSQDLANRVLDMETNAGEPKAAPELQRAINTVKPGTVTVDGVVGPLTIAAANQVDQSALLDAFRNQRETYYEQVEAKNPDDEKYLSVWLARARA